MSSWCWLLGPFRAFDCHLLASPRLTDGIYLELFTDFCYDVLDKGDYVTASLISTTAGAAYSAMSIFGGTVLSTLSDSIGRVPLYKLACVVDMLAGVMFGVLDDNWAFVIFNGLQGFCDATTPIGYALLAGTNDLSLVSASVLNYHQLKCSPDLSAAGPLHPFCRRPP